MVTSGNVFWKQRVEEVRQRATGYLQRVERQLNHSTGYDEITLLKERVALKDRASAEAKQRYRLAKEEYAKMIANRSSLQRELNGLLQRKHTWSPEDLARFTELYQHEHTLEQKEGAAKDTLTDAEDAVEQSQTELMTSIRERYNGEQMYSDRIRSISTYGTLALIILNFVSFLLVHAVIEPMRRRRLVRKITASQDATVQLLDTKLTALESSMARSLDALAKKEVAPQRPIPLPPSPAPIQDGQLLMPIALTSACTGIALFFVNAFFGGFR